MSEAGKVTPWPAARRSALRKSAEGDFSGEQSPNSEFFEAMKR
jgi:hypothetical protein